MELTHILITSAAVTAVALCVTSFSIFEPLRNFAEKKLGKFMDDLLKCPYCFSFWASVAMTGWLQHAGLIEKQALPAFVMTALLPTWGAAIMEIALVKALWQVTEHLTPAPAAKSKPKRSRMTLPAARQPRARVRGNGNAWTVWRAVLYPQPTRAKVSSSTSATNATRPNVRRRFPTSS